MLELEMSDIFISDLHIGINAETNLYQKETHEKALKKVLKFIESNCEKINNVVILGDWIDLWMYKTTAKPQKIKSDESNINEVLPIAQQIFEQNPGIFADDNKDGMGNFVSCFNKIKGKFYYVNGNHDISLTEDEITDYFKDKVNDWDEKFEYCGDTYFDNKVHGEHGHFFSMVCKPIDDNQSVTPLTDTENEDLPFGYFMTRLAADADVKAPEDMTEKLTSYTSEGDSFSTSMLKTITDQYNSSKKDKKDKKDYIHFDFTMPSGFSKNAKLVAEMFHDIDGEFDLNTFLNTDGVLGTLGLAPQAKDILKNHARDVNVVVMGHTHNATICEGNYVNSGYLCGERKSLYPSSIVLINRETQKVTLHEF